MGVIKTAMQKGFTLVELVVGIVVLAIAMLGMNTMLISQSKDALEPVYRLRASQLGQSVLQDILARAYDQNSDHNGGYYRCGEIWSNGALWFDFTSQMWVLTTPQQIVPCTLQSNYGPDIDKGEVVGEHQNFNDVDDFIVADFMSAVNYGDVLGTALATQYSNYLVKIVVGEDTTTFAGTTMKRIDVTIKTPSDEEILFSALKGNY